MIAYQTLGALLEQRAVGSSDKIYLYWKDEQVSYAEFDRRVNQVANGLRGLGVGAGQKVALLLRNCPEFLYTFFACAKLGAVAVPINPQLKSDEIHYILDNSESVALIAGPEFAPIIEQVAPMCPQLGVVCYTGSAVPAGQLGFNAFWEQPDSAPTETVTPDTIVSIIYTSGTTGRPKGVLLSHANYIHNTWSCVSAGQMSADDRMLCILPLFHVNAQVVSMLSALYADAALILLEGFSPRDFLPALARYRATMFSAVPTIYAILNNLPDASQYDLSNLRVCICGAAPMPVEVYNAFERIYKAFVLEGYGLSEGTCASSLNPLDGRPRKVGSIGVPLPGQEIQIVDDNDQELPAGQVGEIVVRGANVMHGYYRNPEATAATVRNGWLHTGDLGSFDADGYLYIVGRKKEMIIRGGENIYPKEVEEALYRHPAILEAAVVGLPDPVWGEEVGAYLVLRPGQTLDAADVIAYCKEHLADYKCPKIVRFVAELPKTATGKVQKGKLVAGS
jgi:long-chain acyl-CoA synthetase